MLLLPVGAHAGDGKPPDGDLPEITGVRVGFAGHYKVGLWTPVEVTLRGGSTAGAPPEGWSGELSLIVPDGDGVPSRVATPPDQPCRVSAGRDTRWLLYARFGRIDSTLTVEFRRPEDGRLVASRNFTATDSDDQSGFPLAVAAVRKMIVCVGADPLGVEGAIALQRQAFAQQTIVVRLEDAAQLPGKWLAYEGVDTLVLSTSRPEVFRGLSPQSPQIVALEQWVHMGGRLVLCVGSQAQQFQGGDALLAPLARFLPGKLETQKNNAGEEVRLFPLQQPGALETYCASSVPIPTQALGNVPRVPKLAAVHADGVVEAQETDLPLVVRAPRGFGQIVFFAGDLDRQPLSQWRDRPRFLGVLLELAAADGGESGEHAAIMHYGFDDLAGQLRSALDQFSGVSLVPFSAVVALIVLYLLLIGPADYFFLRKIARRMVWTWLTFPLIVLLFSVGVYLAAQRLKGNDVLVNQLDLVDVDVDAETGSGLVRGTSWFNLFSPQAKAFNLSLHPTLPDGNVPRDADVSLSWLGLPGEFLGGMNARASHPVPWTESYDLAPEMDAIRGVPIQIWSTKSLTARWTAQTQRCPSAKLVEEGGVPVGTITNTLAFPLSKCFLIYGRHVYTLTTRDSQDGPGQWGTLQPGESTVVDASNRRSELKTMLTGQKLVKQEGAYRQVSTPYDQSSVDLPYVLQAMMFFEAAGGRGYTGLGNGYQGFVDLSHLLTTRRAVLVAQGSTAPGQPGQGAHVLCNDRNDQPIDAVEDRHVTVYRFVFPVKTADR